MGPLFLVGSSWIRGVFLAPRAAPTRPPAPTSSCTMGLTKRITSTRWVMFTSHITALGQSVETHGSNNTFGGELGAESSHSRDGRIRNGGGSQSDYSAPLALAARSEGVGGGGRGGGRQREVTPPDVDFINCLRAAPLQIIGRTRCCCDDVPAHSAAQNAQINNY